MSGTTASAALWGTSCTADYVVIPHAGFAAGAAGTAAPAGNVDRHCGTLLACVTDGDNTPCPTAGTTATAVKTNKKPFQASFISDVKFPQMSAFISLRNFSSPT